MTCRGRVIMAYLCTVFSSSRESVHSAALAQTVLATSKIAMLFQRDVQCFCSMPSRHLNRSLNSSCSCGSPASSRKGLVAQMVPFGAGTMQCSAITTMISAQSTFSECLDVVSSCLLSVQAPSQPCKALQVMCSACTELESRKSAAHAWQCAQRLCKCSLQMRLPLLGGVYKCAPAYEN
jgi:hypothetical protein